MVIPYTSLRRLLTVEYLSPKDGGLLFQRDGAKKILISPRRLRSELILISLFLALSIMIVLFCTYASASPVPMVRVLVEREKQILRIDGFDLLVTEAETNRKLAHENRRASLQMKCSLGGKMEVNTGHLKFRASGPLHVTSLGGFVRVGQSQFRDDLYVYSFNGDCIVVNHVDLEKYVAGLLNSEMSAHWNMAALMAQAVAARTYAIHQMKDASGAKYRGLRAPFDLDSSVKDQVYEGAHMERFSTMQAVQATRGLVLTYQGKPIKSFYHSTCGGRTETPDRVWGLKLPYMKSVQCPYCSKSPRFNWIYSINAQELGDKIRKLGALRGALVSLRVATRNSLGRAAQVEVVGTGGAKIVAASRIRDILGTLNLRSTDFSVVRNPAGRAPASNNFVFMGHGSGHGVGMCQYGAKAMGDKGRTYAEILAHYYPAAQITKLY